MATTVNNAFAEFMKDTVNIDPTQTKTARASRDNLLANIIPIGWVSFYPVSSMLGIGGISAPFGKIVALTLVAGILVMIVAGAFFTFGLKRYESAGN